MKADHTVESNKNHGFSSSPMYELRTRRAIPQPNEKDFVSKIKDLISILSYHRIFVSVWVGIVMASALTYLQTAPGLFSAEASLLLEFKRQAASPGDSTSFSGPILDSAQADSQIQVIKSERLLRSVYNSIDPATRSEFQANGIGALDRLRSYLFLGPGSQSDIDATDKTDLSAFRNFARRVNARRLGQSYVLEISFFSKDPKVAARLVNSIMIQYLGQQIAAKAALSQNGAEYLQGRVLKFQTELEAVSRGVRDGIVPDVELPDADARIISAALLPSSKSYPQRGVVIIAASIFGIFSSILYILGRRVLKPVVRNDEDLSRLTSAECFNVSSAALGGNTDFGRSSFSRFLGRGKAKQLARRGTKDIVNFFYYTLEQKSHVSIILVCYSPDSESERLALALAQDASFNYSPIIVDARMPDDALMDGSQNIDQTALKRMLSSAKLATFADPKEGTQQKEIIAARLRSPDGSGNTKEFDQKVGIYLTSRKSDSFSLYLVNSTESDEELRRFKDMVDGAIIACEAHKTSVETIGLCVKALNSARIPVLGSILIS